MNMRIEASEMKPSSSLVVSDEIHVDLLPFRNRYLIHDLAVVEFYGMSEGNYIVRCSLAIRVKSDRVVP